MTERSFAALARGEIEYLDLAVCVGVTNAKRETPWNGVWRLDRRAFLAIAASIHGTARGMRFATLEAAIAACDDPGPENRFFRLNPAFADWLDATEPTTVIDYTVA